MVFYVCLVAIMGEDFSFTDVTAKRRSCFATAAQSATYT